MASIVPGGDASRGSPRGIALFSGEAAMQQHSQLSASQETLVSLAEGTGGEAFLDAVELGAVFDRVVADIRTYYVLGYAPRNKAEDGRFRHIEVKTRRPHVTLKYRPGYFAARSFNRLSSMERERQLEEVFRTDRPFFELPLLVQTSYFRKDSASCLVPLSVRLAGSDLQFDEREKQREAEFDFMARVTDRQGRTAGIARDTVDVHLPAPSAEKLQHGQIFYSTTFELPPGEYTLRTVVRDNLSGKLGSFEARISVPVFDGKRLQTSSVILASRLAAPEDPARVRHRETGPGPLPAAPPDPFTVEQGRLVPSVGKVFLNRQTLYVYFQIYGAAEDPASRGPNLETYFVLMRNQTKVRETEGAVVRRWTAGTRGLATVVASLPLREFRAGSYTLQAHTRDAVTDTNVFSRITFVIN
jgi:hypothetical protein